LVSSPPVPCKESPSWSGYVSALPVRASCECAPCRFHLRADKHQPCPCIPRLFAHRQDRSSRPRVAPVSSRCPRTKQGSHAAHPRGVTRRDEHTSELQSLAY